VKIKCSGQGSWGGFRACCTHGLRCRSHTRSLAGKKVWCLEICRNLRPYSPRSFSAGWIRRPTDLPAIYGQFRGFTDLLVFVSAWRGGRCRASLSGRRIRAFKFGWFLVGVWCVATPQRGDDRFAQRGRCYKLTGETGTPRTTGCCGRYLLPASLL